MAESRAQISEAATREETSQLELDAATADVSSERELSAANARRGIATDALRVESDGAQRRAGAAREVTGLILDTGRRCLSLVFSCPSN